MSGASAPISVEAKASASSRSETIAFVAMVAILVGTELLDALHFAG